MSVCWGYKEQWEAHKFTHSSARQEDGSASLPWTGVVADAAHKKGMLSRGKSHHNSDTAEMN